MGRFRRERLDSQKRSLVLHQLHLPWLRQRRLSWIREQRKELKKNAFLGTARQMPRGNGTRDLTYTERVTDVEKCVAPRVCGGRQRLGG